MNDKARLADFARRVMDLRRSAEGLFDDLPSGEVVDWMRDCVDHLRDAETAADEAAQAASQ